MTDLRQFTNYSGYYARLANQTVLDERPSIGIHSRIQKALMEEALQ